MAAFKGLKQIRPFYKQMVFFTWQQCNARTPAAFLQLNAISTGLRTKLFLTYDFMQLQT